MTFGHLSIAIIATLLLAVPLGGCLGEQEGAPTAPTNLSPGETVDFGGFGIRVYNPVALPGGYSSEPSIAVSDEGTIIVTGPAGSNANPTLIPYGGYAWVSNDGGQTFQLALDPQEPLAMPFGCSCDTDAAAQGGTLYATTMYWTVRPMFNANLVASADGGETWDTRSVSVADHQLDRPWLRATSTGTLYFLYSVAELSPSAPPDTTVFIKQSDDGGRSWSVETEVVRPGKDAGSYLASKPLAFDDGGLVVPLKMLRAGEGSSNAVAVRQQPQNDFRVIQLSHTYDQFDIFDLSVDGNAHRLVAAWSSSAQDNVERLYARISFNGGLKWEPTRRLEIPGSVAHPWVAVRSDGLTAIAYYGTRSEEAIPNMDDKTSWQPMVALFDTVTAETPIAIATLSDAATYHGILCNFGQNCPEGKTRTPMREFLSAAWGPDGNLHVAWTDARDKPDGGRNAGRVTVTSVEIS